MRCSGRARSLLAQPLPCDGGHVNTADTHFLACLPAWGCAVPQTLQMPRGLEEAPSRQTHSHGCQQPTHPQHQRQLPSRSQRQHRHQSQSRRRRPHQSLSRQQRPGRRPTPPAAHPHPHPRPRRPPPPPPSPQPKLVACQSLLEGSVQGAQALGCPFLWWGWAAASCDRRLMWRPDRVSLSRRTCRTWSRPAGAGRRWPQHAACTLWESFSVLWWAT